MWLHSLKVAKLLRSAACLHTNQSRSYLNHLVYEAYLKVKIEELETNSKINKVRDLHRGINDFKQGYQPSTTIVKDEKGDLVADSHSIMARWRTISPRY